MRAEEQEGQSSLVTDTLWAWSHKVIKRLHLMVGGKKELRNYFEMMKILKLLRDGVNYSVTHINETSNHRPRMVKLITATTTSSTRFVKFIATSKLQ